MAVAVGAEMVVVKLGGDVLVAPALGIAATEIARARAAGRRLIVVHGGGPQTTELSRRLGIEPRLVGGRRITDEASLDVVKMVVAGRLNVDLVAALRAAGVAGGGPLGIEWRRSRPSSTAARRLGIGRRGGRLRSGR